MKKTAYTALLAILCFHFSVAQVSITSANYNTVSLNETNVLQAMVLNNGSSVSVTASVSCRNSGGETILEAVSKPFALNTGINSISGITVGFSRFTYGHSNQALYLKNTGMLPSGNFVYCLKIDVMANGEEGDIFCEDFASATDDFLNLVVPYDGDTLEVRFPVLTWTHSEPFNALAQNEYYKMVVAEIKSGQSPEQAIVSNPVVYSKSFLNAHSIPYPADAQPLEEGKSYAWQVQKFSNNIMVNKTEVWRFVIPKEKAKPDIKYAVLKRDYDATYYHAYNEKIFFQFEEPYLNGQISYTIYNSRHKKVKAGLKNEDAEARGNTVTGLKHYGHNRYELDVSEYNLKPGYYYLEVQDAKRRRSVLKFYINK